MKRRSRSGRLLLLVGVVVLAGCSTDGPDGASGSPIATVAGPSADSASPQDKDDSGSSAPPSTTGSQGITTLAETTSNVVRVPAADESATNVGSPSSGAGSDGIGSLPPIPGPTVAAGPDEEAEFGTGVSASLVAVEPVDVEGRLPGERSGPGVVVTLEMSNRSAEEIDLNAVTVDLVRSDGSSAVPVELLDEPGVLRGTLDPGDSATGRYQFFIPFDQRQAAIILVSYAAAAPTALFLGGVQDA